MQRRAFYIVNGITLYRMLAVPVLLWLVIKEDMQAFKWLLPISFFTDAIDGFLARRYNVISKLGAKLDSIADDLTIGVSIVAMLVFKPELAEREFALMIVLVVLYLLETTLALIRYGKISAFHTYTAKLAAILQGIFFISIFLIDEPLYTFFRITAIVTMIDLIEEIILIVVLPQWQTDVRSLYHVLKARPNRQQ
jgi:phosphatidylglycerophosphate synthase